MNVVQAKPATNDRRRREFRRLLLEGLEDRRMLAGVPELLVELGFDSYAISEITEVAGNTFFVASTREHGKELWRLDPMSPTGANLVKDIRPGLDSSSPTNLTNVGGTLFFTANDGTHGSELWKSDGTTDGTVLVKDIQVGAGDSSPVGLTNVAGTLYFAANNGTYGRELWKSDGTAAGTVSVKDIQLGAGSSNPAELTNVGGTLFFTANDGTNGRELWKSNGTEAGTFLINDIQTGPSGSTPNRLTNVAGTLFFTANDGTHGGELWKSDGTSPGTTLVKDIQVGAGIFSPQNLTNVGGTLFFTANDGTSGYELWKSDGTEEGTVMVQDLWPGNSSSQPHQFSNVDGTLFFAANDGTHGWELWKSDGTGVGTVLLDLKPGSPSSYPYTLTSAEGTLFFVSYDSLAPSYWRGQLWKSDGTIDGTVFVMDIWNFGWDIDDIYSWNNQVAGVGNTLLFANRDYLTGLQVWISDGTTTGTQSLTLEQFSSSRDSDPLSFTEVGSLVYFTAYDKHYGTSLMRSNGTEVGTILLKDSAGIGAEAPEWLTNVGGTLFFTAVDESNDRELWKSDGTPEGTVLVKDIRPGNSFLLSSHPKNLINVNGTLFFTAYDDTYGHELWKSDGTEAGTILVKDIRPGLGDSRPEYLTNVDGTLYFSANDGTNGRELWKSDGTEAGTVLIKNISPSMYNFGPMGLSSISGTLYFSADDGTNGRELWRSDGTEAGTILVKDILPGSESSGPYNITNLSGTLYFSAREMLSGYHSLWKSDGTEAGTVRVKDMSAVDGSSNPRNFINADGTLFFRTLNWATEHHLLWKSDGTEAGTVLVKDMGPSISYFIRNLTSVNETVYFAAYDAESGMELWQSDGTEAGTFMVRDINVGSASSIPYRLTNVAGTLYFSADDGISGREPWILRPQPAEVVLSHAYHKGSTFAAGGSNIPAALDTGKQLAKEGAAPQTLTYDNLINTSRGINGLVFDIDNLPASTLTADDFEFQMSPTGAFIEADHPPEDWQTTPSPSAITVLPGSPNRVVIEWPDNAIANRWLRVTIKANSNTGLAEPEVYYLGHLLGEMTGPQSGIYSVSNADVSAIRSLVGQNANIATSADIDKNSFVGNADISLMRSGIGVLQLRNITIPAAAGGMSMMSLMAGLGEGNIDEMPYMTTSFAAPPVEPESFADSAVRACLAKDQTGETTAPPVQEYQSTQGGPTYNPTAVDWLLASGELTGESEDDREELIVEGDLAVEILDEVWGLL